MVTFRETAKKILKISDMAWKILYLIEKDILRYEKYPLKLLCKKVKANQEKILYYINELLNLGFIEYYKYPYESVRLLTAGVDALALRILANKGLITSIGKQIGVGKESDVYEALDENNKKYSIKVYRLGRTSFKDTTRKRSYYNVYFSKGINWIIRNYKAAAREYRVLKYLYSRNVKVPEPIANVKHMIVMEELEGDLLINIRDIENPGQLLNKIINEIAKALDAGIINADLSPFNVFITKSYQPVLIDWPQFISINDDRWMELLKRDIKNIVVFFNKRFGLKTDIKRIFIKMNLE
jgi:RIO kinase 2